MYRSIWFEYYSLSLGYLENTGASAVCLLPKHPAAACLIWQSYHGTSHTLTFPAAMYTDKGLLQVQSTSKTTGDTLPPRVVLPFGSCSFLTNPENAVPVPQMEQFFTTKEQRDGFECHTWLNEFLISYSCYVPAWCLYKSFSRIPHTLRLVCHYLGELRKLQLAL